MKSSLLRTLGQIKLHTFISGVVVVLMLALSGYREYSWSASNFALRNRIKENEKDIESLKLQLLVDEMINFKEKDMIDSCSPGSASLNEDVSTENPFVDKMDNFSVAAFQEKLSKIVGDTTYAINMTVVDLKVLVKPYMLNWNGLLLIILMTFAMLLETFYGHSGTVYPSTTIHKKNDSNNIDSTSNKDSEVEKEEEKTETFYPPKWSSANKYFEIYIAKKKILSNAIMYFILFFIALLGWLNIITRIKVISNIHKFLILWTIGIYISFFLFNFIRIKHYFPKDNIELKKCLFKYKWWLWLLPRLFTSEGFLYANYTKEDNGLVPAIFSLIGSILRDICCFYPYYYFYYYNDYYYKQSNGVNININNESMRRRNIFLLNMILQLSISMIINFIFTLLAFGSPIWVKKLIKKFYNFDVENSVSYPIIILIGNTILVLLRIIWYFFVGNSTWFATLVSFFFLFHHVFNFISINCITTTLMEKAMARTALIESFVRTFIGNHIYKYSEFYERDTCEYRTDDEVVEAVGALFVDLFEALLDKTGELLYYTILYYVILYYVILYYTMLYYTILYYTLLYYAILYYTKLYYTILY